MKALTNLQFAVLATETGRQRRDFLTRTPDPYVREPAEQPTVIWTVPTGCDSPDSKSNVLVADSRRYHAPARLKLASLQRPLLGPTMKSSERTARPLASRFLAERAIESFSEDDLGLEQFVRRLIRPLLEWPSEQSLVVGLYGQWGYGKSSLLNLIDVTLKDGNWTRIPIPVRFNPWLYSSVDDLLTAFFTILAQAVGRAPKIPEQLKETAKVALTGFGFVLAKGAKVATNAALAHAGLADMAPHVASGAEDIVKHVADAATSAAVDYAFERGDLETQKRKTSSALAKLGDKETPGRVIVLIDDLDRADPPEVMAMLKLVRLIADLPNVTYVLAMDDLRVGEIIGAARSVE